MEHLDGGFLLWLLAQLLVVSFVLQLVRRRKGRAIVLGLAVVPVLLSIGSVDALHLGENDDGGIVGGLAVLGAAFFGLVGLLALLWTLARDRRDALRGRPAQLVLLAAVVATSALVRIMVDRGLLLVVITIVAARLSVAIGRMDSPHESGPMTDDELAAQIRNKLRNPRTR